MLYAFVSRPISKPLLGRFWRNRVVLSERKQYRAVPIKYSVNQGLSHSCTMPIPIILFRVIQALSMLLQMKFYRLLRRSSDAASEIGLFSYLNLLCGSNSSNSDDKFTGNDLGWRQNSSRIFHGFLGRDPLRKHHNHYRFVNYSRVKGMYVRRACDNQVRLMVCGTVPEGLSPLRDPACPNNFCRKLGFGAFGYSALIIFIRHKHGSSKSK